MNLNYDSYYGFKKNHNICEEDKTDCILILCPPQFLSLDRALMMYSGMFTIFI